MDNSLPPSLAQRIATNLLACTAAGVLISLAAGLGLFGMNLPVMPWVAAHGVLVGFIAFLFTLPFSRRPLLRPIAAATLLTLPLAFAAGLRLEYLWIMGATLASAIAAFYACVLVGTTQRVLVYGSAASIVLAGCLYLIHPG